MFAIKMESLKNPAISFIFQKALGICIVCNKCGHGYKKTI